MARGHELEEHRGVDGQVAADADAPRARERAQRDVPRARARRDREDARHAERDVERRPAPPHVGAHAPEHRAHEEADVLAELEEGPLEGELVDDGGEDEPRDDGPEVVREPAEAGDDEEDPLVAAHADVLQGGVEEARFSCVDGVELGGGVQLVGGGGQDGAGGALFAVIVFFVQGGHGACDKGDKRWACMVFVSV